MVAKVQSTKVCGEKSTREKCKSASSFSSYRLLHTSTGYGAWRARREYYNTYQHAAHESVFARTFRVRIARHRVYLSCTTRDSCFSSCDVHVHTLGKAYYSYTLPARGLFSAPKYPRQRTATAPNRASSRLACSKTADPVSLECPRCDHAGGSWAEHTARRGPTARDATSPAHHPPGGICMSPAVFPLPACRRMLAVRHPTRRPAQGSHTLHTALPRFETAETSGGSALPLAQDRGQRART